jgi:hypothetical protein
LFLKKIILPFMTPNWQTLELVSKNALLIEKNKAFAAAMKAGRPHHELVEIYNEVKDIYTEIAHLKRPQPMLSRVA